MTQIIAFAGKKQSGKTTSAEFVVSLYPNLRSCIYNFADPLKKNICMDILGLTYDQCYGSDIQKNELVNCYWQKQQMTAREVMQFVGTDIFRNIQTNVWANATINKIHKDNLDLAIIADCRFPNEVSAIKQAGGCVIKLNRNPYSSNHASEIALDAPGYDHSIFDLVIDNHNIKISEQNTIIAQFLAQLLKDKI